MKWINLEDKSPQSCEDILFTDGKEIYKGWLETYEPEEELCFYNEKAGFCDHWPENITHWMSLPKPPKVIK